MRVLIPVLLLAAALPALSPSASACHIVLPLDVEWSDGGKSWVHVYYDSCLHMLCVDSAFGLLAIHECAPG
ncbi:MAG TPA: hypothetical protein VGR28_14620 [Candidatus Thermoplasmatota archaeon]|jgi:hypothetical protein|nr:hypothetical protein [Candidatus Thermoplasmatota archaeon]